MINPVHWLQLEQGTRSKLAKALNIPKSGGVVVNNGVGGGIVISDGHTAKDLFEGITLKKLQEFVGSTEKDFLKLFDLAVAKVESEFKPAEEKPVVKTETAKNVKKSKDTKAGA